ncbi:hypothetical protein DMUE_1131 [Dictyocoela muelleri]|nr:hypothetical protein DMUE_1131 [Dictyocoela muelleri]
MKFLIKKLVEAFTAANILLNKLQTPALKSFLEKYTGKTIHDVYYYRRMLERLFIEQKLEIYNILKEKDIYLMFDETTDVNGRYILNILGGICSKYSRSKSYLIHLVELSKITVKQLAEK